MRHLLSSMLVPQSHKWAPAFCLQCKTTPSMESIAPSIKRPRFQKQLEASACMSIILERLEATSKVQTAIQTAFCRCLRSSMKQRDTLIKVAAKERDPLQSILSLGMLMFLISFNLRKIMAKKKTGQEICSMLYGSPISSWKESLKTVIGPCFVQTKPLASQIVMVPSLKNCTFNTKPKAKAIKPSKLKSSGKLLSKARLKQEPHICFSKIMQMANQTNRI